MEDSDFIDTGTLEIDAEIQSNSNEPEAVQLPGGQTLSAEDLYPIFAAEKSSLCVLVGDVGSGKTALLTCIYHAVLAGMYQKKYLFAGSHTLLAFEERAYSTRVASMRVQPDVGRTPKGSINKYLHLRFERCDSGEVINLLATDFSGEDYNEIHADVNAAWERFPVARAANCFVYLLDGERLQKRKNRDGELLRMEHLLRTFSDGGLLKHNASILIAVSKYDLIEATKDDSFQPFAHNIVARVEKKIPKLEGRCRFYQIAAMPNDTEICPVGYGVDRLLDDMLERYPARSEVTQQQAAKLESQFNLWGDRARR